MQKEKHYKDWPNAQGFSVATDQRTKIPLVISGRFPGWVAGSLYRTAPSAWKLPSSDGTDAVVKLSHWFDGFTTVHKFDLHAVDNASDCHEGWYSSHSHVDQVREKARETGKFDFISFGQKQDPCDSLYNKVKTLFQAVTPNPNIGVVFREPLPSERDALPGQASSTRKLLTLTTDNASASHFDANTLEPLGITDQRPIHPELKGPLSASHACHDPATGDVYNYNLELGSKAVYRVFRGNLVTGESEILASISGPDIKGAYIHSLFLTEHFVILSLWPAHLKWNGISLLWNRNLLDSLAPFDLTSKTVWLVIDRQNQGRGLVKKFYSPAFFSFHSVNAWEEESANGDSTDVVVELYEFDNMDILHRYYYENLVSNESGALSQPEPDITAAGLVRYRLQAIPRSGKPQPSTSVPTAERIMDIRAPAAGDLPRINPRYAFRKHRFVYSMVDRGKSSFVDAIAKTDTETGSCLYWHCDRHTPGEPIFVPAPASEVQAEDEGVLLCVVLNGDTGCSYLLCLDAQTMEEMGRADVDRAVGLGYHGVHVGLL